MSINTQCGYCGQPYLLDDQYAGQSVACAKCGQTFLAHNNGAAAPPSYSQLAPGYPPFSGRPSRLPMIVASAVGVVLVVMLGIVATLLMSRGLRGRQQAASGSPEIVPPAITESPRTDDSAAQPAVDGPIAPPPTTNATIQPAPAATQNVPVVPPAPPRDRAVVFPELLAAMNEQLGIARGIFNDSGAKAVAPRWAQCNHRVGSLEREFNSTPPNVGSFQQSQAFQQQLQQLNAVRQQIFQERGRLGSLPGVMPALLMAEAALAGGPGSTPGQGGSMTIIVVVHQLPIAAHQHVQQRLLAIMGNGSVNGSGNGQTATFTLTPVDDLDAFAAEIDFGRVTIDRERRTITVQADPAKLPKNTTP